MLALCPEHPKRDQNPKFTTLSEMASFPTVSYVYRRMRFLILGRALGLKKKNLKKKKIISILGIGGLVPRHQSFGARKTTRREPKINIAEKLADVVAKLRQRGKKDQPPKLLCDIKMAEKRRYNFFFFFLENAQNLGRSDDAKRRKKRGCPYDELPMQRTA